jgi:hypothetical protein
VTTTKTRRRLAVATLVALLLAACATAGRRGEGQDDTQRQEIIALSGKISEWRREAGLAPTPATRMFNAFYQQPSRPAPISPMTNVPEACRDICSLADYICQAADDVCRIAGDLPGDDWARRKCASAKASCVEARERCDACQRRH